MLVSHRCHILCYLEFWNIHLYITWFRISSPCCKHDQYVRLFSKSLIPSISLGKAIIMERRFESDLYGIFNICTHKFNVRLFLHNVVDQ